MHRRPYYFCKHMPTMHSEQHCGLYVETNTDMLKWRQFEDVCGNPDGANLIFMLLSEA